jgi:hypothetical protein
MSSQETEELPKFKKQKTMLNKFHSDEIMRLNNSHSDEITRLNKSHSDEITRLNKSHSDDITLFKELHDIIITTLYQSHIENLLVFTAKAKLAMNIALTSQNDIHKKEIISIMANMLVMKEQAGVEVDGVAETGAAEVDGVAGAAEVDGDAGEA